MKEIICAHCLKTGLSDIDFEFRGKYQGLPVVKCNACGSGLQISNPGRAVFSKKASTILIDSVFWKRMTAKFEAEMNSIARPDIDLPGGEDATEVQDANGTVIRVGDSVKHKSYGVGQVISIRGRHEKYYGQIFDGHASATVHFVSGRTETLAVGRGVYLKLL
jgi:hypothetical protein